MSSDLSTVHILVVDDSKLELAVLEKLLQEPGYNLVTAASGPEAIEAVATHDFAVIILDVQMHGMDGFETATRIKAREGSRLVPIIFLTGVHKEKVDTFMGYAIGAVDYILKPFKPELLKAKVKAFVELKRAHQEEAAVSGEPAAAGQSFGAYERVFADLWAKVVPFLGEHAFRSILKDVLKELSQRYPSLQPVELEQGRVSLEGLKGLSDPRDIDEAKNALNVVLAELTGFLVHMTRGYLKSQLEEIVPNHMKRS